MPEKSFFGRQITDEEWYQLYYDYIAKRVRGDPGRIEELVTPRRFTNWAHESRQTQTPLGSLARDWVAERLEKEWEAAPEVEVTVNIEYAPGQWRRAKLDILGGVEVVEGEVLSVHMGSNLASWKIREVKTGWSELSYWQKEYLVLLKRRGADVVVIGEHLDRMVTFMDREGISYLNNYSFVDLPEDN